MAKVRTDFINQRERYYLIGNLFDIVSNINSKKEVIDFLLNALTPSEVLMIARRIQIAEMILEDKSYEEIRKELGVGYHNIASVHRLIQKDNSGYKKQVERHLEKKNRESENKKESGRLLDRYPQHRFLKELLNL